MAKKLKTTTGYLRLVITGHKIPGAALAKNLHDITNGEVDKHQLRPDIF
ncbi:MULTISPECIES: helix-turn-helix domain-containing protein [unclassified Vibrio]|nr:MULTISPECIES: helix-turn-helix domain-containing protein [unclassified Vibrio]MDL5029933.1 helix-turn-helix domain-containing protein [Vibrio sp. TMPB1044]MDN5210061.1 helix-turn-helix domain-containing protein [Vibrio sp. TMPB1044]